MVRRREHGRQRTTMGSVLLAGASVLFVCSLFYSQVPLEAQPTARFANATSSQPLALSASGEFLASVNPDGNSVSFFDLRNDRNRRVGTVPVQVEPNGVAMSPNGRVAYVANTVSGTVSILRLNIANGVIARPHRTLTVGTEPYALVLTPNGTKLYVANARSNSISVIDTASESVIRTINNAAFEPRGLAITNDGDADDTDELLFVTSFLSRMIPGKIDGQDDAKAGRVSVIQTGTDTVGTSIAINPIADTGFFANGNALDRIGPGASFTFPTGAYVNQLNNVAIKGDHAYLPNTGASPNGPVRFDVNTHSLVSVIDINALADAGQTINMHKAVADQTVTPRLFITQPWAMATKHAADQGYVVSAASNILVKLSLDPSTGRPEVQLDPTDPSRVLQVPLGKNPRGIVINPTDTRAYVMNYVSRDISVVDLTGVKEQVMTTMVSSPLPVAGTTAATVHAGKELYNTSVGVFDPAVPGDPPIVGRMSNNGWGACSACHPFGLSDQVVWIFPAGPRKTIPQHADFDPTNTAIMRMLNWSSNRDEQEDFENNIRGVSGGAGLIVLADGVTQDANVNDFLPLANGGRNQLKVNGIDAWDALKAFVQVGIRAPISPIPDTDPDAVVGRALFAAANCQQCHGGPQWTRGIVPHTPPPAAGAIVAGQIVSALRQVGTFDPAFFNEIRQNAQPPLGAAGFVTPSLLSAFAFEDIQLHNGPIFSFDEVLNNVTHRSAGTGGIDTLSNASDRAKVARFLRSIDASTTPIP